MLKKAYNHKKLINKYHMKTIVFQQVAVKEYVSPAMTTMQLCSEGVLCGSVNGILDLDYIYDEEDKE